MNNLKRKLIFTLALSLMFASTIGITNVVSAEAGGEGLTRATPIYATYEGENEPLDAIAITVIVPPSVAPTPEPTPIPQRVFPASVSESYNAFNVREVVRTYELLPHENPEWINTDSFTRNGYFFKFAELTRQTDLLHTSREHTEVLEIETARNDLEAIISGLSTTMNYTSEDGYSGVLKLNLASVSVSQNGSRTNSRTVSQTREYPHLSSADVSLIPQTITVDGRVYTLNDVTWGTNATSPVDFNAVTTTFTAVATYTRTATSTSPTGFTTRIEYTGTLTRVSTSDVRFVATFIGTPIATVSTRTLPDGVLQT